MLPVEKSSRQYHSLEEIRLRKEELADAIDGVSREEVILAANLVSEDTVYILDDSGKEA